MKTTYPILGRFCAVFLFSVFLNPLFTRAQVVGGGTGQPVNNNTASTSILDEDDFYSAFSIGIVLPEGLFGQAVTNPFTSTGYFKNLTYPFQGQTGLGATTGYNFGYSAFVSLSKVQMGPSLPARFGLQFGFDFDYMPISWSNVPWSKYDETVTTNSFLYMGFKIGPQFNVNPMDNMGIGIYATINPSLTIPGGINSTYNYTDGSGDNYNITYNVSDTSSIHLNIDVSAGINFYYKALIIGIEYDWIHTKYNGAAKENEIYTAANGAVSNPSSTYTFNDVFSMDILKFTIGLRFGTHVRR